MKSSLTTYLAELQDSRGPGVKETSYYPALANLLNAVGSELKPKVKCVIHPKGKGAGLPDGGLFTVDQLRNNEDTDDIFSQGEKPARGVIEAKGVIVKLDDLIKTEQIAKYLAAYGSVLMTNLREFALAVKGANGQPEMLERFALAETESVFWKAVAQSNKTSPEHAQRFEDFLKRALLHEAALHSPQDVAWFLASYAREARMRLEHAADAAPLDALRNAFETALGITFNDDKGEHFFRSAYVQTLFYGVFSAWTLWHKENPARQDKFDWRLSSFYLRVAVMQALFGQVAQASTLRELNLIETLDWTGNVLNRVERAAFFAAFEAEHALQYFYEPFLKEFDPELRKSLGVWYTPPEIVKYMVARVDDALRNDLVVS